MPSIVVKNVEINDILNGGKELIITTETDKYVKKVYLSMSKLGINTGTSPNAGNGDTLLVGAIKINSNFDDLYSFLGDGTNLNVSQYGVIDNDGEVGTISVIKDGANVRLIVTPISGITPVTVRFGRMGLKA